MDEVIQRSFALILNISGKKDQVRSSNGFLFAT